MVSKTPRKIGLKTFLKRTLRRLEKYGWRQGAFGGAAGPNCLVGAMIYVPGETSALRFDAEGALGFGELSIIAWNDAPKRTFKQVKARIEKAIAKL